MKKETGSAKGALLLLTVVGLMFVGYGMNLYKLFTADFEAPYKNEIIHGIGVIPIFGWVTGYVTIDDTPKTMKVIIQQPKEF
tara:strand:- start:2348 stop:2593 length:246 start_codon:yes stop_codon:yes gene_type:complete